MKKLLLSALVILGMGVGSASAQENVVGLNLGSLAFGEFQVSYERALSTSQSIHVGLPFLTRSVNANGADWSGKYSLTGIGVIPEYRFYFGGHDAPKGFYGGPFAVVRSLTGKVKGTQNSTNESVKGTAGIFVVGGGGIIGHQWLISDVFSIDLNVGAGYYSASSNDIKIEYSDGTSETYGGGISVSGVLPKLGLSVGVAF